ncbi:MAG TPA: GNAT family N-acetyltransferase [Candidatus Lokiarchaeia archaeon]|nr:GNAT family N-acetyltransferase [Candidatus Lokiarchaeia archaeon]
MNIKVANSPSDFGKIFVLRYKVFMLEQEFHEDIEIDEHDDAAIHLFVDNGATAAATLRLFWNGDDIMLGRMAVSKDFRGTGVGRALLKRAIEEARKLGGRYLMAHSQMQALGFYEKAGFEKIGDEFEEEGVMHQLVRLEL